MVNQNKAVNKRPSVTMDVDNLNQTLSSECDVLIIGAGLAGLSTALSLPSHLQITVLAKKDVLACSSNYAQGGIAAVIDLKDSVAEHVNDTLIAGDGLCHRAATTHILQQGRQAIQWLLEHDVPFTTISDSTTKNHVMLNTQIPNTSTHQKQPYSTQTLTTNPNHKLADLHLTKEGGHGRRRVAHADDATGKHIMQSLLSDVAQAAHITLLPYHEALQLLTNTQVKDHSNRKDNEVNTYEDIVCEGAVVYNRKTKVLLELHAKAVVLASGGLGQLFDRATAPSVCIGDGIMMAWEAGCRLANLEFVQFHPTGLALSDTTGEVDRTSNNTSKNIPSSTSERNFLISEALRGEGAYLLDPETGIRFMPAYDQREELAPRDIVARAIANEIDKNGLGYVHLDISHQPADFIKSHFPDIYAYCLSKGIDITSEPIPVAPTAHYTCGGVMTTATGQTDVKGLYAAGEVAHTGLHGANRLASNSLLECVVVGRAVAKHIPTYLDNKQNWASANYSNSDLDCNVDYELDYTLINAPTKNNAFFDVDVLIETDGLKENIVTHPRSILALKNIKTASNSDSGINNDSDSGLTKQAKLEASDQLQSLKQLMSEAMGIKRSQQQLSTALNQIKEWQQSAHNAQSNFGLAQAISHLRWQRLLNLVTFMLLSAQARMESRGGHYREDCPTSAATAALSIISPFSTALSTHEAYNQPLAFEFNSVDSVCVKKSTPRRISVAVAS